MPVAPERHASGLQAAGVTHDTLLPYHISMANEHRFTDEEVALILARAVEVDDTEREGSQRVTAAAPHGLSLADIQQIASEAGIAPAAVAAAASMVRRGDLAPTSVQSMAGAPLKIARTIRFGCEVDDQAWARMVVLLQETFAARGRLRTDGALREWSNGNLRAVLEPTAQGHQLRLSTRKSNAGALRIFGNVSIVGALLVGLLMLAVNTVQGAPPPQGLPLLGVLMPALIGVGVRLADSVNRRAWGRERARQFDALPGQLRDLLPPGTGHTDAP